MAIQLSQVGEIVEDHLENNQNATKVKVTELYKNGNQGVVGGKYKVGKLKGYYFICEVSLDDGSIISKQTTTSNKKFKDKMENYESQASQTNTQPSNEGVLFQIQNTATQIIMAGSIALTLLLIVILGSTSEPKYTNLIIVTWLGIGLSGYYDIKLCKKYNRWNAFSPLWLIALFLPGMNAISGIVYLVRRWTIVNKN